MIKVAAIMASLMCAASVVAYVARPSKTVASEKAAIHFEVAIPKHFGVWREEPKQAAQVVNPQTQALLDRLYSQTLSRVYVDSKGYRIMLSLAHGDDQRGGLQAHLPEVCYPAQGFNLRATSSAEVKTAYGVLPVRRLDSQKGARIEPVTYWFTFADRVVSGRFEKRWTEIKLGLTGRVPNGLLFRVSSIDSDLSGAFVQHERFVNDLLGAVSEQDRVRLSGLRNPS